ncbi:hypothetical protein [Sandaracinus amylolyticus]|uniref:Uncharacterized protein n=1 Tax=Sandaracinus amylolyticus TaxID=927083 RepID=A0A0F6SI00_9BACT|nr:hypothetical protein [Sandaracinus amylolyticus]AKF11329.1 hypothetical protein DB32_008478 [Sandaracinus amylolyticus]
MGPSVVLLDMVQARSRQRAVRAMLGAALSAAGLVGVYLFASDMLARAAMNPMGRSAGGYVCAAVGGLPCLVALGLALITIVEARGGGPDARFLIERWSSIASAQKKITTYTMKGAEVGSTASIIITEQGGAQTEITVRAADVDRAVAQINAELSIRR